MLLLVKFDTTLLFFYNISYLERSNPSKQVLSRNASLKSNTDSAGNLPEGDVEFIEETNVLLQSATPPHTPTDTLVHRQISVTG